MIITDPLLDSKPVQLVAATSYGTTTSSTASIRTVYPSMGHPSGGHSNSFSFYESPSGGQTLLPYQYQPQEKSSKSRTRRRFFKTILAALGLYLIIYFIIRNLNSFYIMVDVSDVEELHPTPADGDVLDCFPRNSSNYTSGTQEQVIFNGGYAFKEHLSYSISPSSELIYFLSRGDYGHGSLQFVVTEDDAEENVKVDITVEYNRRRILERSRVCLLTRKNDSERGVGFFTPRSRGGISSRDNIRFTVVVKFPRSNNTLAEPLFIKGLDTQMGIWTHSLSLGNLVGFDQVSLRGNNAYIRIHDVLFKNAECRTNNAPITGSFTTSDKIILKTANGPIDIVLTMKNEDASRATVADLRTSNGAIKAPISLVSEIDDPDQPAMFSVYAETNNSPLTLSFPKAPASPFSILNLVGTTSNSAVTTTLHPTFEGSILLESTLLGPHLQHSYAEDPSGQGRVRVISTERIAGGRLSADVKWGEHSPPGRGVVSLKTANAPNTLYL